MPDIDRDISIEQIDYDIDIEQANYTVEINPTSTFQTYGSLVRDAFLKGVVLHKKSFH